MLTTLQMAIVGVVLGVLISLPLSLLAARNTSPNWAVRTLTRTAISVMRTIPDLIWAMIFVIMVGFGPLAGILAIVMDTIGFCGRFFSERIEETSKGPAEALTSTGARRHEVILGAIVPEAMPSFVATSLYAVEKAIRSAVVLGLVGAGGIGVELSASIDLFKYDQACTIILLILGVVIATEQLSGLIRKRLL
jgi:phosphonate transport system permease protein